MLAILPGWWGARWWADTRSHARMAAVCVAMLGPLTFTLAAGGGTSNAARVQTPPAQPTPPTQTDRDIADLLQRIETAAASGDSNAYLALTAPDANRAQAQNFATLQFRPGATHAVVRERDRLPITDITPDTGYVLVVDAFIQFGERGSVATWRLDVRRYDSSTGVRWLVHGQDRLTVVEGLYKLHLDATRQLRINNLKLTSEDLTIAIPSGIGYAAESDQGSTAFVLIGDGEMAFAPKPAAEKGQVKLFAGNETLRTKIRSVFVRVNPSDLAAHFSNGSLVEEPVDARSYERAQEIFAEQIGKSFGLDLSDLSRETWSLVPPLGDFLAEIATTRFGTLTFAQAANESEDISLFDRRKRHNISAYASARKLATRGRFYSDDDQADYVVEHYDIQTNFSPERDWLEGRTVLRLRVSSYVLGTLTLRLADTLAVHTVTSPRFGRLLALRVKGQNSVLINLPAPLSRGDELTLAVSYAGRLETATPERELLTLGGEPNAGGEPGPQETTEIHQEIAIPPERRTIYTNRSYWYPQSPVPTYATAQLRLSVPEGVACVASGTPANGNPMKLEGRTDSRQLYVFSATQPARYFAVVLTRLSAPIKDIVRLAPTNDMPSHLASEAGGATMSTLTGPGAGPGSGLHTSLSFVLSTGSATPQVAESAPSPTAESAPPPPVEKEREKERENEPEKAPEKVFYSQMELGVVANPRQASRARSYLEQATTILSTYANLLHDLPYPSFSLALVDDPLPGGHSPAYFAVLHQPLPMTNYTWRNDPVNFDRYPQFFIAHELAHQFWGDAVGGENYHEQWISEGFAQYFALLYAERTRSKDTFEDILRQLRRTSIAYDHYGPVWLGYRLGHLQGDSRIFRALVYNKGALVLHMLRRLVGDEAFFNGMRRFYRESRFKKVGTDDVRKAFEAESGLSLERFFDRWIMQAGIPQVSVSYNVEGADTNRDAGPPLTFPLTVVETSTGPGARPTAADHGAGTGGGGGTVSSSMNASAMPAVRQQSGQPQGGASVLRVRVEQKGEVYDFPLTIRVRYASGQVVDTIVPVRDAAVDRTVPLKGRLESVEINPDDSALIEVVRR